MSKASRRFCLLFWLLGRQLVRVSASVGIGVKRHAPGCLLTDTHRPLRRTPAHRREGCVTSALIAVLLLRCSHPRDARSARSNKQTASSPAFQLFPHVGQELVGIREDLAKAQLTLQARRGQSQSQLSAPASQSRALGPRRALRPVDRPTVAYTHTHTFALRRRRDRFGSL